ncbi:hypothetical protein DY000_02000896 [Brassica cretica]|uniref:Uncharacterized protein n=1 Tax=Brassica cretica TaxID=69181 RepID=A0ABQ7BRE8_BRACR|nr:hypothetical protein DY000_02000896 [Brassica cretica]
MESVTSRPISRATSKRTTTCDLRPATNRRSQITRQQNEQQPSTCDQSHVAGRAIDITAVADPQFSLILRFLPRPPPSPFLTSYKPLSLSFIHGHHPHRFFHSHYSRRVFYQRNRRRFFDGHLRRLSTTATNQ